MLPPFRLPDPPPERDPLTLCDLSPLPYSTHNVISRLLKNTAASPYLQTHLRRVAHAHAHAELVTLRLHLAAQGVDVDTAEMRPSRRNVPYRLSQIPLDYLVAPDVVEDVRGTELDVLLDRAGEELAACVQEEREKEPHGPLRDVLAWYLWLAPDRLEKRRGGQAEPVVGLVNVLSRYVRGEGELEAALSDCVDKMADVVTVHTVARLGKVASMEGLKEDGLDLALRGSSGNTALHAAAEGGSVEMVRYLIAQGVEPGSNEHGWTLVHAAARGGHVAVLNYLVEPDGLGLDPALPSLRGATPLHVAASRDVVERLVELGVCLDSVAYGARLTALMHACASGASVEVVKALLGCGADASLEDADGRTALTHACANGASVEVVKELLECDVDVTVVDVADRTALMHACANGASVRVVKELLERDADVSLKDTTGHTALMHACSNGASVGVVKALLERGSDVSLKDSDGVTALMHACASDASVEVVEALLGCGADTSLVDVDGRTALTHACGGASVDVVKVLLARDVDLAAVDTAGRTALMHACARGASVEVVKALLERDADTSLKDKAGRTPLVLACANGASVEVVRLLLEHSTSADTVLECIAAALRSHSSHDVAGALLSIGFKAAAEAEGAPPTTPPPVPQALETIRSRLHRQALQAQRGSVAEECVIVLRRALHSVERSASAQPQEDADLQLHRQLAFVQSVVRLISEHQRPTPRLVGQPPMNWQRL